MQRSESRRFAFMVPKSKKKGSTCFQVLPHSMLETTFQRRLEGELQRVLEFATGVAVDRARLTKFVVASYGADDIVGQAARLVLASDRGSAIETRERVPIEEGVAAEVRMVQQVEGVQAELCFDFFAELPVLVERDIRVDHARSGAIAAGRHVVGQGPDLPSDERERFGIEDLVA